MKKALERYEELVRTGQSTSEMRAELGGYLRVYDALQNARKTSPPHALIAIDDMGWELEYLAKLCIDSATREK